jgi:hypothetical protein
VAAEDVVGRLRDASFIEDALAELGLDPEMIRLVASLSPTHGITELSIPVSVCVG